MRIQTWGPIVAALLLAGCGGTDADYDAELAADFSEADDAAPESEFGFQQASAVPFEAGAAAKFAVEEAASNAAEGAAETVAESPREEPTSAQAAAQIAYSYSYGFRITADKIEALQQSHAALCEKMGPTRCRVLNLARAGTDDDGFGRLELRVAADEARGFGTGLAKAAEEVGGEQASFAIDGEDLTERIVDTEAHLESRHVLRERLMEVLRARQGTVGDLVDAERAVAEVNEELDSAATELTQLRNRIRMSAVSIEYGPDVATGSWGFTRPVAGAFSAIGTTLGVTIAAIVYIAVALIPIIPFLLLLRWLWRRSGLRLRRERRTPAED